MPRALWKGHVSFGLVEIPVVLRSAEEREGRLAFKLIDRRDHSLVGYQHINKTTGAEVPWDEIVKGYEHEPDRFVLLSEAELDNASPEAAHTIEITDFVEATEIHPMFWSDPYYLLPARAQGNKAYALLRETLERSGRVGIAQVVLRTRQHLAALTTRGPALMLVLLRYARELVDPAKLDLQAHDLSSPVTARELQMASRLVESMSADWKPERYQDTHYKAVMALIERKARSGDIGPVETPAESGDEAAESAGLLDLMPLLKRSVASKSAGGRGAGRKAPAAAKRRRTASRPARAATRRKSA